MKCLVCGAKPPPPWSAEDLAETIEAYLQDRGMVEETLRPMEWAEVLSQYTGVREDRQTLSAQRVGMLMWRLRRKGYPVTPDYPNENRVWKYEVNLEEPPL